MTTGFFAFNRPGPDRMLSSWFLASTENNYIINKWCRDVESYWHNREEPDHYFWFHYLFGSVYDKDSHARNQWDKTPKLSADSPHSVQVAGILSKASEEVLAKVDWNTPLFKMTYKFDTSKYTDDSLLHHVLNSLSPNNVSDSPIKNNGNSMTEVLPFASLKVSTKNLGDHIQILAGLSLLTRLKIAPKWYVDRDDEIASANLIAHVNSKVLMLINGWFKTNPAEWPPNSKIIPLFIGFHIRLFQSPSLISAEAIEYYKQHEPIGCRDIYTQKLLSDLGVKCYDSNCLTFTLPRRLDDKSEQDTVFVSSRDKNILNILPSHIGEYTYINHYSETTNFDENIAKANQLLTTYKTRAKLIITTFLHCAIPALAMGIPVIVFYPKNNEYGHQSDRERYSSLSQIVRIYYWDEIDQVDWNPEPLNISSIKLSLVESFRKTVESYV
jgi:hypothetical protein